MLVASVRTRIATLLDSECASIFMEALLLVATVDIVVVEGL